MHVAQTTEHESKVTISDKDLNIIETTIVQHIKPCLDTHTSAIRQLNSDVKHEMESMKQQIASLKGTVEDLKDALLLSCKRQFLPAEEKSFFRNALIQSSEQCEPGSVSKEPHSPPALTKKGKPRKNGNYVKRVEQKASSDDSIPLVRMTDDNRTVADFWTEYKYGLNCQPALKDMERDYGAKWRKDDHGKKAKAMAWARRKPIYSIIEFNIDKLKMPEAEAVAAVQKVFDQFPKTKNGRVKVKHEVELRKVLTEKLQAMKDSV